MIFVFLVYCSMFFFKYICCAGGNELFDLSKNLNCDIAFDREYFLIASADGKLTAIDYNSGITCWSIILDANTFVSSSMSRFQVVDKGEHVHIIPSLDGTLFSYNGVELIRLPFYAEALLDQYPYVDEYSSITGGKVKNFYGINRYTGVLSYHCTMDECKYFNNMKEEDLLIIEERVNSVRAIDSRNSTLRWHFRVAELNVRNIQSSTHMNFNHHYYSMNSNNTLLLESSFRSFDSVTVSLLNGYISRLNISTSWIYKSSSPILDVWYIKDSSIILLDPFGNEGEFVLTDFHREKHGIIMFLGFYKGELFIKQSKTMKAKKAFNTSPAIFSKDVYCEATNTLMLMPKKKFVRDNALISGQDISGHGYFFYANKSVYSNDTHCVMEDSLNKHSEENVNYTKIIKYLSFTTFFAFLLSLVLHFFGIVPKVDKIQLCHEGTSTELYPVSHDQDIHNFLLFDSRFCNEYKFISLLGRGGFGIVMEAENKIDECCYAVKRIPIAYTHNDSSYNFVIREVKHLAKLDHPGIVRYFNSWIENPPKGWQQEKDCELNIFNSSLSQYSSYVEKPKSMKSIDIIKRKLKHNPMKELSDASNITKNVHVKKYFPTDIDLENSSDDYLSYNMIFHRRSHDFKENSSLEESIIFKNDSEWEINSRHQVIKFDDLSNNLVKIHDSEIKSDIVSSKYNPAHLINNRKKKINSNICYSDSQVSFIHAEKKFKSFKESCLNFLKDINGHFVWNMHPKNLSKLLLSFVNSEHHHWSSIFKHIKEENIEINLNLFQKWLISALCVTSLNVKMHELSERLSSILYEVNLVLCYDFCKSHYNKCRYDLQQLSHEIHVNCLWNLTKLNDNLAYPLKFSILCELSHVIFCCHITCAKNWSNVILQGIEKIDRSNLHLFQIWIISTLLQIKKFNRYCDLSIANLTFILSEVNYILDNNSVDLHLYSAKHFENKNIQISTIFLKSYSRSKKCPKTNINSEDKLGFLYIQMQLCKRQSLQSWLDCHYEVRDYNEIMTMFWQIVDAIDYVHTRGLMHRDLKPSNIYFSLEGYIKIGDFGLATGFIAHDQGNDSFCSNLLEAHTQQCGTTLYMSPEQYLRRSYTYKTDIYSLGIILFELFVPFQTYSEKEKVLNAVRDCKFNSLFMKKYPKEVQLLKSMLHKNPKSRPSAQEIRDSSIMKPFKLDLRQ